MKQLEELYDELEKYNIPVVKVDFHNKKAGIASNGKDTVIAVDYKKIENSISFIKGSSNKNSSSV